MNEILIVGIVLFFGYLGGKLIAQIKVPIVTGYILVGLALGTSFLHIIPYEWNLRLSWLIDFALLIVAFNIGGELNLKNLNKLGKALISIVIWEALGAYLLIFSAMLILHQSLPLSMLIAAVGCATAPAVTVLVLNQYRAQGPLTQTLLGCVGIDDAMGLALYSVSASLAHAFLSGTHIAVLPLIGMIVAEILFSLAVGLIAGLVLNYLLRLVRYTTEPLILTLGAITLAGGLLQMRFCSMRFSPLLASMAAGFYISNFSPRRRDAFRPLESFGYPFYTIYFVLAGARLQVRLLIKLGLVALGYLIGRISGKVIGASFGALISKAPPVLRKYTGLGLFSQAGIAIGLCMVAAREFPTLGDTIVAVALGTTIVTELIGPLCTKYAITKAGEIGKKKTYPRET